MIGGGGYYMYKNKKSSDSETPGSTLTITEDGASVTENYRMMPRRENYIQVPNTASCYMEDAAEWCGGYDKIAGGFAYVYDLSLADIDRGPNYTACPGGGHDCWYMEKYDSEGTLTAVTNKDGVSLIHKIADDIWDEKLDPKSRLIAEVSGGVEMKDGSLVAKKNLEMGGGNAVRAGEKMKPSYLPGGYYFIALFVAMKQAGMKKPDNIVIDIKNAKDVHTKFVTDITKRHEAPSVSKGSKFE
jgi:hypothetical protein